MRLFTFEPGDGISYKVLFGRLPSETPLIPHYLIFGFGEAGDALIMVYFDTEQIDYDTFARRWQTAQHTNAMSGPYYIEIAAYSIFAALTGNEEDSNPPVNWPESWRQKLPAGLMG